MTNYDLMKDGVIKVAFKTRDGEIFTYDSLKEFRNFMESKAEILDSTEKRYLKNIIRPFKDMVMFICKNQGFGNKEWITIKYKEINSDNPHMNWGLLTFPFFERGTMYTGMEIDYHYTPEELGL